MGDIPGLSTMLMWQHTYDWHLCSHSFSPGSGVLMQVCGGHAWFVPSRVAPSRPQPLSLCAAFWHCSAGDCLPMCPGTGNAHSSHGWHRSGSIAWHPDQGRGPLVYTLSIQRLAGHACIQALRDSAPLSEEPRSYRWGFPVLPSILGHPAKLEHAVVGIAACMYSECVSLYAGG